MDDPFALDLTINLLLLGFGGAMFAGSLFAYFGRNYREEEFYASRTLFLGGIGFFITFWAIASIVNN
ncbi:MAG: hypothetical protein ISQ80_01090 [Candidatus Actinomarina sp.]|jgi:hypothetical protein|nr:hypothetical protein [Actinomycetota bacterium]MBL6833337.1 hypothetical protein [Candidatus Actinomarina sp.]MBL6836633.1 hypothetical protein [Candidatus Actinomarina sp.]